MEDAGSFTEKDFKARALGRSLVQDPERHRYEIAADKACFYLVTAGQNMSSTNLSELVSVGRNTHRLVPCAGWVNLASFWYCEKPLQPRPWTAVGDRQLRAWRTW
jgi:hypothetical protein